jgi:hypothetical protein
MLTYMSKIEEAPVDSSRGLREKATQFARYI